MPIIIGLVLLLVLVYFPQWWVKSTLQRYHKKDEDNFPGNGGEYARHILKQYQLDDVVVVEMTDKGDHYDSGAKAVRLTKDKYEGKTLTAITVAAHEVGHALQHAAGEPLFIWRNRLEVLAIFAQKLGAVLMMLAPILGLLSRMPSVALLSFMGAFLAMGVSVVVQLITLPVEFDASFRKALPILNSGYLTDEQKQPAKKILKAAALTYVAASLVSLLSFWRWVKLLKR